MSSARFTVTTIAVFFAAFVCISWGMHGFPMWTYRIVPVEPSSRIPTSAEYHEEAMRKAWLESQTSQGDGDAKHDALRLETVQTANAYAQSPCDETMKKNLVAAITAYVTAWSEISGCRNGYCGGNEKQLDAATAAFTTPADKRVREAVGLAVSKGGIVAEDFPKSIRLWALGFQERQMPEFAACHAGQSTELRR